MPPSHRCSQSLPVPVLLNKVKKSRIKPPSQSNLIIVGGFPLCSEGSNLLGYLVEEDEWLDLQFEVFQHVCLKDKLYIVASFALISKLFKIKFCLTDFHLQTENFHPCLTQSLVCLGGKEEVNHSNCCFYSVETSKLVDFHNCRQVMSCCRCLSLACVLIIASLKDY